MAMQSLLTNGLMSLARSLAPIGRGSWFQAMAAEFEYIPKAERLRFAAGCALAALKLRLGEPKFQLALAHGALVWGALGWALLNMRFAGRMSFADAFALEIFAYAKALLFVVGAAATARFGHRATIALASPLVIILTAAAVVIRFGQPQMEMSDLYVALILEDITVLISALLIAFGVGRLVFRQVN